MSDTIVIHFKDLETDQVSWQPLGKKPSPLAPHGRGSLEEAAEQIKGWRHLAVVSSNELMLTHVDIPAKHRQRLIQAIPYTLENDLTEEIDALHFAHQVSPTDGTAVAVVSRQRVSAWLERMEKHHLSPRGLYPGVFCLPYMPTSWSVYLNEDFALVRTASNAGFVTDAENLPLFLNKALDEVDFLPDQLDLYLAPQLHDETAILPLADLDVPYHLVNPDVEATRLFSENLDEKHGVNLLQGDFKQIDQTSLQWRKWLPAAVIFCVLLGIHIVSTVLDYSAFNKQSRLLAEQTRQVFRDAFPDIKRIVDPKVQMEQQLKLLRKGGNVDHGDFLSLLSPPASTVGEERDSRIESISYRDGKLDLKMLLKDLQSLDDIKRQIEAQNLSVEIRSANASGKQITSHLRIIRSGA
ncbi:MAG: type II secretion system protein GspL [Gammaproteobacteria bacterium]|nr:type II secretion system protein GspL [Gammaproteobacteria bacterium]